MFRFDPCKNTLEAYAAPECPPTPPPATQQDFADEVAEAAALIDKKLSLLTLDATFGEDCPHDSVVRRFAVPSQGRIVQPSRCPRSAILTPSEKRKRGSRIIWAIASKRSSTAKMVRNH